MTEHQATRGWTRILLFLSLGLNLALIGLILGARMSGHGPMGRGGDVGFGPLSAALQPDDRRALRKSFFDHAPDLRAERQQAKADFLALADLMRAEPLDRAAAEAILARQGERGLKRLELGRKLFLDYVATLDAGARRTLADRIEAALDGPPQPGP